MHVQSSCDFLITTKACAQSQLIENHIDFVILDNYRVEVKIS